MRLKLRRRLGEEPPSRAVPKVLCRLCGEWFRGWALSHPWQKRGVDAQGIPRQAAALFSPPVNRSRARLLAAMMEVKR